MCVRRGLLGISLAVRRCCGVDDLVFAAKGQQEVNDILEAMNKKWAMTDTGEMKFVLGWKVVRDRKARTIHLSQPANIGQVPERSQVILDIDLP